MSRKEIKYQIQHKHRFNSNKMLIKLKESNQKNIKGIKDRKLLILTNLIRVIYHRRIVQLELKNQTLLI